MAQDNTNMKMLICDNMALCTDAEVQRLLPLVSAQRRETALRYKHTFGQWTTLQSWLMLRELGLPDKPWSYNDYGKPFLPDGPYFSLSHCKTGIAVAIDTQPIGIDIESYRDVSPELIEHTMNQSEQDQINASDDPIRTFTELWTRKEAYVKYLGTGIAGLPGNPRQYLDNTAGANIVSTTTKNYAYSICTKQ